MPEQILIKRANSSVPFGFKLQGGQDFSVPLSILEITPNSVADVCGLRRGDSILKVNNNETSWMDHNRGKQEIMNAGDQFWLTVERNAVNAYKPQATPLSALKPSQPQNMAQYSAPSLVKTSLAADKGQSIVIGSSHNRAPMPFNRGVGNTIVYQAQKPTNWQPGDYTTLNEPQNNEKPTNNHYNASQQHVNNQHKTPQQPIINNQYNLPHQPINSQYSVPQQPPFNNQYNVPHQAPINNQFNDQANNSQSPLNNQYNSPIGLYSKANLMQEIRTQTKVNTSYNEKFQNSAEKPSSFQAAPQIPSNTNGVSKPLSSSLLQRGSLSMRMLNKGLEQCEGTDQPATSVFDLKRGNNPTGATVPKGFKSVMAPVELPPEQRHAPMRKEFQVQHVKQNWIEPKML